MFIAPFMRLKASDSTFFQMKTYLILTSYYFTPLHNSYTYSLQLAVEKKTSFLMGISNKVRTFLFYQSFRNWLAKNNFPCQSSVLMKIVFLYQFNFLPIWWRVMTEPAESLKVQGGVTSDALKIEPNDFLAIFYFILQNSHEKAFKMKYTRCLYIAI